MTATAPIALFAFNRPDHTRRTLEALLKNRGANDHSLFVFADGPRRTEDEEPIRKVRELFRDLRGFQKVQVFTQSENRGLASSIIAGVSQTLTDFERIIVVEDDLVTSPLFLQYMNTGLERYENNEQVASIHGYVYPVKAKLPSSYFVRGADCWGWSTWRRGWRNFNSDSTQLLHELQERNLTKLFDFDGTYPYTRMLEKQIRGEVNSWAIRWYASAFLKDMYTLYPGRSYVENIGMDGSGTHTDDDRFGVELEMSKLPEFPTKVAEESAARRAFEDYFVSLKPLHQRLLWKITHGRST